MQVSHDIMDTYNSEMPVPAKKGLPRFDEEEEADEYCALPFNYDLGQDVRILDVLVSCF